MNNRFLLTIDPPQLCLYGDEDGRPCEHLTAYAEASTDAPDYPRQLTVAPTAGSTWSCAFRPGSNTRHPKKLPGSGFVSRTSSLGTMVADASTDLIALLFRGLVQ